MAYLIWLISAAAAVALNSLYGEPWLKLFTIVGLSAVASTGALTRTLDLTLTRHSKPNLSPNPSHDSTEQDDNSSCLHAPHLPGELLLVRKMAIARAMARDDCKLDRIHLAAMVSQACQPQPQPQPQP